MNIILLIVFVIFVISSIFMILIILNLSINSVFDYFCKKIIKRELDRKYLFKVLILIIVIILLPFITVIVANVIYNYTSDDVIKITILPERALNTYYIEIKPNGVITSTIGKRKENNKIDMSNFFISLNYNFSRRKVRLSSEDRDLIFELADKSIEEGSIIERTWFGAPKIEIYYKGIKHTINVFNDDYNLDMIIYILATNINNIEFERYIGYFDDYFERNIK